MSMKLSIPALLAFTGFLSSADVHSQTAANWNFNGSLNAIEGANITAAPIALSVTSAGSFNAGTEYYGEGGWPAGALDPTAYLQFTISSNAGYYLVLNSVTMQLRRSTTGTGSGPQNWSLRSSLDNYTTNLSSGGLTTSYAPYVVSLPAAYQTIASSVTFRLYGYNMVITAGGNNRFVFDNISAQGQANTGVLAEQSISLKAIAAQQHIDLQWNTIGFSAGTDLSVERSTDGAGFSTIYHQQTTNSNDAYYQYQDISLPSAAQIFYRISATEPDGRIYRSVITVVQENTAQGQDMAIRAIISQGGGNSVKALLNLPAQGEYQLRVYAADGRMLSKREVAGGSLSQATNIDFGSYPHGVYILTLSKDASQGPAVSKPFFY
jgi:hypothetical protein